MNRTVILSLLLLITTSLCAQNKKLYKLYSKERYQEVIVKVNQELQKSPNDIDLNLLLARCYANTKKIEKALPILEKLNSQENLSKGQKQWVEAYLGKCYFFYGKKQNAIMLWEKCIREKSNRDVVRYAKKYLTLCQETSFYKNWKIVESENICFHFQDGKVIQDQEKYIERYEKICKRMYQFFSYHFPKKIDVYVWKDKFEGYQKTGKALSWSNSDLAIVNVYNNQKNDYEICTMIAKYICNIQQSTFFVNSGLGVYFDEMDINLFGKARKEITENDFEVSNLWIHPTDYKRGLSYPVGAAFIEFLINSAGKKKIKKFLKDQTIENGRKVYDDFDLKMKTFNALLNR